MKEFLKTIKLRTILIFMAELAIVCGVAAFIVITNKNESKEVSGSKYTVTFNSNSGTKIESQKVSKNEKVSKPKDPEKENYMFIAWYLNDEIYNFNTKVTKNITLTAKWEEKSENSYIIKFNSNSGTTVENQIVNQGEKIVRPEDPTRSGYTFVGWYLDDKEYSFDSIVDKGLTLTAKWQIGKIKYQTQNKTETVGESKIYRVSVISGLFVTYDIDGSVKFSKYNYTNYGNTYFVDYVDGYEIYRSTDSASGYSLVATTSSTNTTSWISTNANFCYKVRGYRNIDGKTIYGDFGAVVCVPKRYDAPTITADKGTNLISFSASNVNLYYVYENDQFKQSSSGSIFGTLGSTYKVFGYEKKGSYEIYGNANTFKYQ